MLIIDGLHAFDFSLDEQDQLHVECMNGRTLEHWRFTPAQMEAATFDKVTKHWIITSDSGDHHLESVEATRSEEHTSELQSLMRISYAVFCLQKNKTHKQ